MAAVSLEADIATGIRSVLHGDTDIDDSTRLITPRHSHRNVDQPEYRTYKERWYILLTLGVLNVSNAMLWISFSPIANLTAKFYARDEDDVNWLSLIYLVLCIPGGLVVIWMLDTFGLRTSLITGGVLNVCGAILRVISALPFAKPYSFTLVMSGQVLCALAQPCLLFAPTKLAAIWFSEAHRAIANTLGSMGNPLGVLLGSIVTPALVKSADQIPLMQEIYCGVAGLAFLMSVLGVRHSVPPSPPSASAAEIHEPFFHGLKKLIRIKAFWVLFLVCGSGIGMFTALSTLLEQILCPRGYGNEYAGLLGALLIALGIVGAGVSGLIVDKTKKFDEVAKISYGLACLSIIFFTLTCYHRDANVLNIVAVSLFGLFGFAFYPIALELGVECTYPVAEGTSAGLLNMSGQIQGIVLIIVIQLLAKPLPDSLMKYQVCTSNDVKPSSEIIPQDYSVAMMVFAGFSTLCFIVFVVFFHTPYRRLYAEHQIMADKILGFRRETTRDIST